MFLNKKRSAAMVLLISFVVIGALFAGLKNSRHVEAITYQCTMDHSLGLPGSFTFCAGSDQGLTADTYNQVVSSCGSVKCAYTCNTGYVISSGECVKDVSSSAGNGCGLMMATSPHGYGTVLQGETQYYSFRYAGDPGGSISVDSQSVEGVNFSFVSSGSLKDGDTVSMKVAASASAPIKRYASNIYSGAAPVKYSCTASSKTNVYSIGSFEVVAAGYGGFTPGATPPRSCLTASPATVAVGQRVKLKLNVSADSDCAGVGNYTDSEWGVYDPFFLKRDDIGTPGVFEGVNPGTTEVVVRYFASYELHIPVTVTGSAASTSGAIKITDSRLVTPFMFPPRAECVPVAGGGAPPGCIWPITSYGGGGLDQDVLRVFDQAVTPGLTMNILDYSGAHYTGPEYFDITDPMRPTMVPGIISTRRTNNQQAHGDFAGFDETTASGYSNDLGYVALYAKTQGAYIWLGNGPKLDLLVGTGGGYSGTQILFAQHNGFTYAIGNKEGATNVTDITIDPGFKYQTYCGPFGCDEDPNAPPTVNPMPSTFPVLPVGRKEVLTGDGHVAVIKRASIYNAADKDQLLIYNLDQKNPVASVILPSVVTNSTSTYVGISHMVRLPAGPADYLYVYGNSHKVCPPQTACPHDYNDYNPGIVLSVYKFTFATQKLETVVNAVKITGSRVDSLTGLLIGGKPAALAFVTIGTNFAPTSFSSNYPHTYENREQAYLLSDLAAGRVNDVLANSYSVKRDCLGTGASICPEMQTKTAVSYVKGNSTYVYVVSATSNAYANIRVIKFDSSTGGTNPVVCPSGQTKPHFEGSDTSCASVSTCGVSQCVPASGGGSTTGSCSYTWKANPLNASVPSGTTGVTYQIDVTKQSTNPLCFMTVRGSVVWSADNSHVIIDPGSTISVPLGSQVNLNYDVAQAPVGNYVLPVALTTTGGASTPQAVTLGLSIGTSSGASETPASAGGALNFSPILVQDGDAFKVSLSGAPSSQVPELLISRADFQGMSLGAFGAYQSFGKWDAAKTDASGSALLDRTMNCAAYLSYAPGEATNLYNMNGGVGAIFLQKAKLRWADGAETNEALHAKVCLTALKK